MEIFGAFPAPESLAYGGDGLPEKPLYKVGFSQTDLWDGYGGSPEDVLFLQRVTMMLRRVTRKHESVLDRP